MNQHATLYFPRRIDPHQTMARFGLVAAHHEYINSFGDGSKSELICAINCGEVATVRLPGAMLQIVIDLLYNDLSVFDQYDPDVIRRVIIDLENAQARRSKYALDKEKEHDTHS